MNAGDVEAVRLKLLPAFELSCGAALVTLPRSLQRLLAVLALGERAVERSRLAGMLWSDVPESRASANLRSGLWRLRQTGLPLVQAASGLLRLEPSVEVDVHEVQAQADRILGREAGARAGDFVARRLMHDLLEDWYDDWLVIERERFRQVRLHALETLCDRLTEDGLHLEAIEAGLGAVAGEPFRDSAQRALIKAYLAEGNTSEAVRQYRSYEHLLADNQMGRPVFTLSDIEDAMASDRREQPYPVSV